MRTAFFILAMISMAAVLATMLVGVFTMARGGEFNKKYGNTLMRARVGLQGLALAFLFLAFLSGQ